MKIHSKLLLEKLRFVQNGVPSRSPVELYQRAVIEEYGEAIFVRSYDHMAHSCVRIDKPEKDDSTGSVCVNLDRIISLLTKLDEDVSLTFDHEKRHVLIRGKRSRVTEYGEPGEDFVKLPKPPGEFQLIREPEKMLAAIKHSLFAINKTHYYNCLRGLFFLTNGRSEFAASDNASLSLVKMDAVLPHECGVIIPYDSLSQIQTVLSEPGVQIAMNADMIAFATSDKRYYTSLMADRYPNYPPMFEGFGDAPRSLTVNRKEMEAALKTAGQYSESGDAIAINSVYINFNGGIVTITAASSGKGESSIDVEGEGDGGGVTIKVDPDRLANALKGVGTEQVILSLPDGDFPTRLRVDPVNGDLEQSVIVGLINQY